MAEGGEEEDFCENYFLLKVEEASFLDFVRILWCNDLGQRNFFKAKKTAASGKLRSFRHRWIVFISLLLQKILLYLKKPMAAAGSALEMFLNFPAFNGGYLSLFSNLFTGRLVRPDKESERFASLVGNLDKRLNLDTKMVVREEYFAALAMMGAKLSYENQSFVQKVVSNRWQMELLGFYNFWNDFQELNTTSAIMFRDTTADPNLIVVAFRGTQPFAADDWRTDVDISWYEFKDVGRIHGGFMKALGLQKSTGWPEQIPPPPPSPPPPKSYAYYTLRDKLKTLIDENENAKFILTGHSLGGAMAVLFAAVLTIHRQDLMLEKLEGVYTFGQPRVGDDEFGHYIKRKFKTYNVNYNRYVYCNDVVPRLPYDDKVFFFKHFGPCLYFNSQYKGQVLEEEPNKNYFSPIQAIPKIINAGYELIRSFVLPWMKGEEYREEWLMKVFRLTALVFPGLTDHFVVDYVNLTRLGKFT
ncbi:triacylglycerol lipase OBL1-like [Andrographis paniculata]|uniref:triacylglycerol lipase OBL1-like n=1 Tax=Andrographis paniculata TaxID=175694 RepID=UPI0021E9A219|nr:triacylglycerol lipase OBL1-like [Andrographis paniculata]